MSSNIFRLQPSFSWVVPGKQRLPTVWSQGTTRLFVSCCFLFFPTNHEGLGLFHWLATARKGILCFHSLPASAACACCWLALAQQVLCWAAPSPWLSRRLMWLVSQVSGTEEGRTHAGESRRRKRRQRSRRTVWLQPQSLGPSDSSQSSQNLLVSWLVLFLEEKETALDPPSPCLHHHEGMMMRWTKLTHQPQLLVCLCRLLAPHLGWFGLSVLPSRVLALACLHTAPEAYPISG